LYISQSVCLAPQAVSLLYRRTLVGSWWPGMTYDTLLCFIALCNMWHARHEFFYGGSYLTTRVRIMNVLAYSCLEHVAFLIKDPRWAPLRCITFWVLFHVRKGWWRGMRRQDPALRRNYTTSPPFHHMLIISASQCHVQAQMHVYITSMHFAHSCCRNHTSSQLPCSCTDLAPPCRWHVSVQLPRTCIARSSVSPVAHSGCRGVGQDNQWLRTL